jgi:hypothetical protein
MHGSSCIVFKWPQICSVCHIHSLFLFSFMTYGFAWFSFVIFTLCSFFHSWLMALHGLVLSYLLFVSFLIDDLWVCMVQFCHIYSLFLFSFMTYGFPWFSFVIFTLRFFSHSWLMGLHGLVLSYLLFVSFLIHDLWFSMV